MTVVSIGNCLQNDSILFGNNNLTFNDVQVYHGS